jgi:sulfite reductase (NADPH) hemoprotein beta-component
MRTHDIGLQMASDEEGRLGFRVFVGGGQGRIPFLAQEIRSFVEASELLSYLTAILRVYNLHGRRDNIHKARIKILVNSLGVDAFREAVEAAWVETRQDDLRVDDAEIARISAYFTAPPFEDLPARSDAFDRANLAEAAFARWARNNVRPHKTKGYASALISLKPLNGVPGDATAEQMDAVAEIAELYGFDDVRVTYEQNLLLPHVRLDDLPTVFQALKTQGLATPNAGLATDLISCPGLDYCSLANARSIPVAQALSRQLADLDLQERIGEVRINMSGCINACGHHHVGHIGVLGVDKQGQEFYQLTLGGSPDEDAALGEIVGKSLPGEEVAPAIERVLRSYLEVRHPGERFIDTVRRLGAQAFTNAIYETA